MKEQVSLQSLEIPNSPMKTSYLQDVDIIKESDNDSGFVGGSGILYNKIEEGEEIQENMEINESSSFDEVKLHFEAFEKEEENLETKLRKRFSGNLLFPEDFKKWSKTEKKDWIHNILKTEFSCLTDYLLDVMVGHFFEGDCGRSPEEKPDWLDLEKFKRGQKFAKDFSFGLAYSQLLSLFVLFSFEDGLKPLIITGKSSTPYTAFKR